jgi:hypothetical protein
MPRGATDLDIYAGADNITSEALPDGLDFGDTHLDDGTDDDDDATVAAVGDDAGDAADAAGDGSDADGAELGDADAADNAAAATDADPTDADGDDDATDAKPAPAAKEKDEKHFIPKARLDQSIRKQRLAEQRTLELETELAELRSAAVEASRPKPLTGEQIKAKMAEANEALIGGDTEKAATLQAELFASLAPQPAPQVEAHTPVDLAAEVEERLEFKAVVKSVYARFPELDENHESFNEDLGSESVELQRSYMKRGFSMVEATQKAAEAVAKLNDLEDRTAEKAPPAAVNKDKVLQDAKTREKVAKAVKAPPPMAGKTRGEGSDAVNINELSDDEFMALPESVRNKMLGMTL